MNGFKRASRHQAAVVGLAVLMGTSFLGCHAGPRLFSKKDRDHQAEQRELAEKDKGKFINRKKVRPESDYRDDNDEQLARSDSKSKPKPTDTARQSANNDAERAVAARSQPDDAKARSTRSTKPSSNSTKTSKPADRAEIARRDATRRPVSDLLSEDSLFEDKLPESRVTANGTATASRSATSTVSRTKSLDQDPFKDSVIGPVSAKRPEKKVAPVNFFDDDDAADEMVEELDELSSSTARNRIAKPVDTADSLNRKTSLAVSHSHRKFLDEMDEPAAGSFRSLLRDEVSDDSTDEAVAAPEIKPATRASAAEQTIGGQKVIDRRQSTQRTLNDWQQDFHRGEFVADPETDAEVSVPPETRPTNKLPAAKGHLSPANIDEFSSPTKSQGAVLNGELIIDTNSLPSRFQRPSGLPTEPSNPSGTSGRVNSNSGASIDIVPGTTPKRTRPPGQISLQSLSDEVTGTGLATAGFEQPPAANDLSTPPALKLTSPSKSGPRLAPVQDSMSAAPAAPEEMPDSGVGIGLEESSTGTRAWKRSLLVLAALVSAVVIGFGLRRRMELTAEPIPVPKSPRSDPQDLMSWPRG